MTFDDIESMDKIAKRDKTTRQLGVTVRQDLYFELEAAAEAVGMSVADYVRHVLAAKVGMPSVFSEAK